MEFISIKALFPRLRIPLQETSEADVIEWAMQGLDLMNATQPYKREGALLEVRNHRAKLPTGVCQIEAVASTIQGSNAPTAEEIEELTQCEIDYINKEQVDRIGQQGIINNYNLFVKTRYYQNYFVFLRLADRPMMQKFHCEDCPNLHSNCQEEYTITPDGIITTSFESGHLCIGYLTYARDEFGDFMIPNDENLFQALVAYVTAMMWEERANMKEQGAWQMHINYLQRAEILMARCRGTWISKAFNYRTYDDIVYKNIRVANHPSVFNQSTREWTRTK